MKIKGVSPIIAAILLIAFTMALAGIMATWATTFSQNKLQKGTECGGALELSSLTFDNTTISLKVRNAGSTALTGLRTNIEYTDPLKSKQYTNVGMGPGIQPTKGQVTGPLADPLTPGALDFFIFDTEDTTRPQRIEVIAGNCIDYPVSLVFPRGN